MPDRIQRKRTPGWTKPMSAVYVGRGTKWGNPNRIFRRKDTGGWHVEHDNGGSVGTFPNTDEARRFAVEAYRAHLNAHPELAEAARRELAGKPLMCWCPLDAPCHADELLRIANPA